MVWRKGNQSKNAVQLSSWRSGRKALCPPRSSKMHHTAQCIKVSNRAYYVILCIWGCGSRWTEQKSNLPHSTPVDFLNSLVLSWYPIYGVNSQFVWKALVSPGWTICFLLSWVILLWHRLYNVYKNMIAPSCCFFIQTVMTPICRSTKPQRWHI